MPVEAYLLNCCLARTWDSMLGTGCWGMWLEFGRLSRLSRIEHPVPSSPHQVAGAALSEASSAR